MTKAMELLKNQQMTIKEIGAAVGYSNEKYFMRLFKKKVGETPSERRSRYYE